jgi:hypothetical protein
MEEENNGVVDTSNQPEEEALETSNEESSEESNELAERLAKAEELANNYKIRAEKAERFVKSVKTNEYDQQAPTAGDLSSKDLFALMEAKVSADDIDEVKEYASLKKISVAEALKAPIMKSILREKAENRNVANASNVGSSRRGSSKLSDEALLENAKKGKMPDNDADLLRLAGLKG